LKANNFNRTSFKLSPLDQWCQQY